MGLYGADPLNTLESMATSDEIMEQMLIDDILSRPYDEIQEFCNSEAGKVILEKNAFAKKVVDKESQKKMDFNRRVKLMAYNLAKDDPEFAKLKKYQALRKQSINKIMHKYGAKAEKMARMSQKEYVKNFKLDAPDKKED